MDRNGRLRTWAWRWWIPWRWIPWWIPRRIAQHVARIVKPRLLEPGKYPTLVVQALVE